MENGVETHARDIAIGMEAKESEKPNSKRSLNYCDKLKSWKIVLSLLMVQTIGLPVINEKCHEKNRIFIFHNIILMFLLTDMIM